MTVSMSKNILHILYCKCVMLLSNQYNSQDFLHFTLQSKFIFYLRDFVVFYEENIKYSLESI